MIDVCLLGTGGMMPLPRRWLSSLLVRYQGQLILLDCGEGTQISQHDVGWGFKALGTICISHYHADHVAGLPGMLLMVGHSGRTEPLTIVGPRGLRQVVAGLRSIAPELPYEVRCVEAERGQALELNGLCLSTLPLDHSLPCLAFAFDLRRGREFLPERARELDLPVHLWSALQRGERVGWGGREVLPEQVLGPERRGLRLVFATDTRPTPDLAAFVGEADLFVCEGTFGDPADRPKAIDKKHMTFDEAAEVARQGNARDLWLTHFSPSLDDPAEYLDQARALFPRTLIGRDHLETSLRFREP